MPTVSVSNTRAAQLADARPNRVAIRMLFAGFILGMPFLLLVRAVLGEEPYPGPFMPAFQKNGLYMVSPTEASVTRYRFMVTFSDQSTAEISTVRLLADVPTPWAVLYMLSPISASPPRWSGGRLKKLHLWIFHFLPSGHGTGNEIKAQVDIPADIRSYLQRRLAQIYPTKKPTSLTVVITRHQFPLADFHKMTTTVLSQNTITFNAGT